MRREPFNRNVSTAMLFSGGKTKMAEENFPETVSHISHDSHGDVQESFFVTLRAIISRFFDTQIVHCNRIRHNDKRPWKNPEKAQTPISAFAKPTPGIFCDCWLFFYVIFNVRGCHRSVIDRDRNNRSLLSRLWFFFLKFDGFFSIIADGYIENFWR